MLKIEHWEEGPNFALAPRRGRGIPRAHRGLSSFFSDEQAILSQSLKPIGFYVTYSYTLFRKGDDPRDPLYAIF